MKLKRVGLSKLVIAAGLVALAPGGACAAEAKGHQGAGGETALAEGAPADPGAEAGRSAVAATVEAPGAAAQRGDTFGTVIRAALAELQTLREDIAAAKRRNLELETMHAEDAITIGVLKSELERARAEADRLRGELQASWEWIAELNTIVAEVRSNRRAADEALVAARSGDAGGAVSRSTEPSGPDDDTRPIRLTPLADQGRDQLAGEADDLLAGQADGSGSLAGANEGAYYTATVAVNLRARPQNASEVVAVVSKGQPVEVVGRDGGWLRVAYTDSRARDFTGWVYQRFLRPAAPPSMHADASLLDAEG